MTEQDLREMASAYIESKAELDKIKKRTDNLNADIKEAMELLNLEDVTFDDGSGVHYGITTKASLNEDMLLDKLKQFAPNTECIKTKEYIDMDILENEIYHDKLPKEAKDAMGDCMTTKEVPVLTIKKAKKGYTKPNTKELFE